MGGETSKALSEDSSDLGAADTTKLREISRMDDIVRGKVRQGVQYNMKLIICGSRGSGKSCLWKRFQGMPFDSKYTPTPEIQSATINWSFKNSEDNVKVEVWDVVDRALGKKPKNEGEHAGRHSVQLLDASVIDIYKGTHSVIFMINPESEKSLHYVRSVYKEVPAEISMLLVLNFRDLVGKDAANIHVTWKDVEVLRREIQMHRKSVLFGESQQPPNDELNPADTEQQQQQPTILSTMDDLTLNVYGLEVSLLNCFGLLNLHKYLDIPFLRLKQKTLREQLVQAENDLLASNQGLYKSVQEGDYDGFEAAFLKRRQEAQERAKALQLESPNSTPVLIATPAKTEAQQAQRRESSEAEGMAESIRSIERASQMVSSSGSYDRQDLAHNGSSKDDVAPIRKPLMKAGRKGKDEAQVPAVENGSSANESPLKMSHHVVNSSSNSNGASAESNGKLKKATKKKDSNNSQTAPAEEKRSESKKKIKESERPLTPETVTMRTALDKELESFTPGMTSTAAEDKTLAGFLDPSDDDEKQLRDSKDKIRQFMKKPDVAVDLSSNNIPLSSTSSHSPLSSSMAKKSHAFFSSQQGSSSSGSELGPTAAANKKPTPKGLKRVTTAKAAKRPGEEVASNVATEGTPEAANDFPKKSPSNGLSSVRKVSKVKKPDSQESTNGTPPGEASPYPREVDL